MFFNTAVVQMSEAMAHLLMALAQHPRCRRGLAAEPDDAGYLDRVIDETLRLYPLFGIAHRITSARHRGRRADTLPPGSVLCFNYPAYHRTGYDDPDAFRPRPLGATCRPAMAHYIPFGVAANRPCPAPESRRSRCARRPARCCGASRSHSSASHTRSIPNRGPCVLVSRRARAAAAARALLLAFMRVRDRWEDVGRSLVQLVLGTYMVWDARRLRLCERHFEAVGAPAARAVADTTGTESAR